MPCFLTRSNICSRMLSSMSHPTSPLIWSTRIRISPGAERFPRRCLSPSLSPKGLPAPVMSWTISLTSNRIPPPPPSLSPLNQQRDKIRPQALEEVFRQLNRSFSTLEAPSNYRRLAVDGSSFSFFSRLQWASDDYFVSQGHSAKGFYSARLNALYDLDTHTHKDALI